MNWHYVDKGQQIGPVSDEQLQELLRSGKINGDTLLWREGMSDWVPYTKIQAGEKSDALKLAAAPHTSTSGETGKSSEASKQTFETVEGRPEAVCNECGNMFPIEEMIRHGNARICAKCKPIFMQKLAEGAQIQTGEMRFAGIFTRFAAVFLDGIILGLVNMGIGLIAGLSAAQSVGTQPRTGLAGLQLVLLAIQIGIALTYETVLIGKYGATLGKMACKIKVVTADGGRVSYARALGRYFAKMLSAFACLIGYLIAFFDKPQRRALHDHICNTRVILK
jgi:uncharacterized RDD family membrane protein YckC